MLSWIISVFSAVTVITVVSLLLPDGKLAKFIKPFVSLILILLILSPITDIEKYFYDGEEFYDSAITMDTDFLIKTTQAKIDKRKENCIKIAEKNGITGAIVIIEYSVDENYSPKINEVRINLQNAVISSESEHIVILQRLIKEISEYLSISEEGVKIVE